MNDSTVEAITLLLIIITMVTIFYVRTKRRKFWKEKGIVASALVNKIIDSGMKTCTGFGNITTYNKYGPQSIVWDLFLEIEELGKPNRRLNIYHRFGDGFDPPQVGDRLSILIHPKNPDKIKILSRAE